MIKADLLRQDYAAGTPPLETLGNREEDTRLGIQSHRKFPDHLHRRIPRPALDVADVGPMHMRFVAERFLRKL